ncbi:hypothetical protein Lalb_Chr04g0262281 [Lupinus albus]|uniref:Knottin, scorpion toxin n=1 Tax=Lupinus albus TaxID=3870 RepID=A0A6A4QQH8_LUPAL|nr:hypothetical protein Lalb_Chr04g0262281 [Lupinus albus]
MAHKKVEVLIFICMIIMFASSEDAQAIQISAASCPRPSVRCYNRCTLKCYSQRLPNPAPCNHDCANVCGCKL